MSNIEERLTKLADYIMRLPPNETGTLGVHNALLELIAIIRESTNA